MTVRGHRNEDVLRIGHSVRRAAVALVVALAGCSGPAAAPASPGSPAPVSTPAVSTPATPAPAATPVAVAAQIDVGGRTRDYIVVTPPDVASRESLPLLLALHGATMTAAEMEATRYDIVAIDPGAVIVYPQGDPNPDGAGYIWNSGQTDTGYDDVGFLVAIIDRMEADYPIDPGRVFVMGASNGGQMAYRLACERPDRLAAVAVVIGALLVDCSPGQPISVIDIHGGSDTTIPPDGGGEGCLPLQCPPIAQTLERWREIDGCAGDPAVNRTTGTVETTWANCDGGTAVTFIEAIGKGHDWYTSDPDDRAVTWQFFMDHPRSGDASPTGG
jgi:polyhydroxybutyrate depolymerase